MFQLRRPTPAMVASAVVGLLLLVRIINSGHSAGGRHSSSRAQIHATVTMVLDGDTVEIDDGRRVRLLGIDAPEVAHHDEPGERFGPESAEWLRQQLLHQRVILQLNVPETDRYGRTLAWIFLQDGTSISQLALSTGHAKLLDTFGLPLKFESQLRAAVAEAQVKKLGLWARPRSSSQP